MHELGMTNVIFYGKNKQLVYHHITLQHTDLEYANWKTKKLFKSHKQELGASL